MLIEINFKLACFAIYDDGLTQRFGFQLFWMVLLSSLFAEL